MHRAFFAPKAGRAFGKLSGELQKKIYDELQILSANPLRHRNAKKIRGSKSGYRLRLGRWRILFVVFGKEKRIEIVDIFLKRGGGDYRIKRWMFI